MSASVVIVGAGVVGGAMARALSPHHAVVAVDVDSRRVRALREEGIDARGEMPPIVDDTVVFVCVPTPEVDGRYDLTFLTAAVHAVGVAGRDARSVTVAVRSTVTPGTCVGIVATTLATATGRVEGDGWFVASNPEFLRAMHADSDAAHPVVTVIGSRSARASEAIRRVCEPLGGQFVVVKDPATAEFIKVAHNAYNAAKISFWNQMWLLGEQVGVDTNVVAEAVARTSEASRNPLYGIRGGRPYAGGCLPKDVRAAIGLAADLAVDAPLLAAIDQVNSLLEA